MSIIKVCKVKDYLPVTKLKQHPNNPREITNERLDILKNSILEKGFYQPLLVWKGKGIVLSGNHRLLAVKSLIKHGHKFENESGEPNVLPVVYVDVDEHEAMAILFESNNTYATWVEDKLQEALSAYDQEDWTTKFGFTDDQIESMLAEALPEAETPTGPGKMREMDDGTPKPEKIPSEEKESYGERNREIDPDALAAGLKHTCPRCAFEF